MATFNNTIKEPVDKSKYIERSSEDIQRDMDKFLMKGGKIRQIEGAERFDNLAFKRADEMAYADDFIVPITEYV